MMYDHTSLPATRSLLVTTPTICAYIISLMYVTVIELLTIVIRIALVSYLRIILIWHCIILFYNELRHASDSASVDRFNTQLI